MTERPANRFELLKAFALVAVVGTAVAMGFSWWTGHSYRPSGPVVPALGGKWTVDRPQWTEYNGKWRIRTTFYPRRLQSSFNVKLPKIVKSFCGAAVNELPGKPKGIEFDKSDVYRVEFDLMLPDQESGDLVPAVGAPLPVPVHGGRCIIPEEGREVYPRFAGLMSWEMVHFSFTDERRTAVFEFLPKNDVGSERADFPFSKACDAILNDQPYRPQLDAQGLSEVFDQVATIEVRLFGEDADTGQGSLVGPYVGYRYKVLNGDCTDGTARDG